MMARETSDVAGVVALLIEVNLLIVCFKIRPSTCSFKCSTSMPKLSKERTSSIRFCLEAVMRDEALT